MEQILKRYVGTPFDVTVSGSVKSVARTKDLTVRAWTEGPDKKAKSAKSEKGPRKVLALFDLLPAGDVRIDGDPQLALSDSAPTGIELLPGIEPVPIDGKALNFKNSRRFGFHLSVADHVKPGEVVTPIKLKVTSIDEAGKKQNIETKFDVVVHVERRSPTASPMADGGVALVAGALELRLGHLCDQRGCVDHFYRSLAEFPGLAGIRPRPSFKEPGATLYLRAGQAIDVLGLREKLRRHSVEIAGIRPRDVKPYVLRVELARWRENERAAEIQQCLICREQVLQTAKALRWVAGTDVAGGGINVRLKDHNVDCIQLLDGLAKAGIAPVAVWLVPEGVPMPKAAAPRVAQRGAPKQGGSVGHPLMEFRFSHRCDHGTNLLHGLGQAKWTSRANLRDDRDSATLSAAIKDRQHAILTQVFDGFHDAGRTPQQIRLSEFGDVRIQLEFDHVCGEIEYSKPPKKPKEPSKPAAKKKEKQRDAGKKEGQAKPQPKKPEPKQAAKKKPKPFVPKPLRPAASSNGRKAIEAAVARVGWIKDAIYQDYHTKATFRGPSKFFVAFQAKGQDVVRLDELITELRRAGFPPKTVTVSRLFPGIPFAKPLPADLELTDRDGKKRLLSSLRQPGKPLAVAFVSLKCPRKKKYQADPKFYARMKKTMEDYRDRVTFVAISANKEDKFPAVVEFLKKANWDVPLLHDASGTTRAVFNAQATPPPHLFVFDANGLFRYAGDPHDSWEKPENIKKIFLEEALKLVLAGKYQANGAVFFNKTKCNCSDPNCKCPKCGCGPSCRCAIKH